MKHSTLPNYMIMITSMISIIIHFHDYVDDVALVDSTAKEATRRSTLFAREFKKRADISIKKTKAIRVSDGV